MGLFTYDWSVPADQAPGTYLVTWTGTGQLQTPVDGLHPGCQCRRRPRVGAAAGLLCERVAVPRLVRRPVDSGAADLDQAAAGHRADGRRLVAAVYRVDADGMPLDPQLANVLVRATSAQVPVPHRDQRRRRT